jgi:hypothetical protein
MICGKLREIGSVVILVISTTNGIRLTMLLIKSKN